MQGSREISLMWSMIIHVYTMMNNVNNAEGCVKILFRRADRERRGGGYRRSRLGTLEVHVRRFREVGRALVGRQLERLGEPPILHHRHVTVQQIRHSTRGSRCL